MKKPALLFAALASLLIAADAKDDLKKEKEKIKGSWSVVSIEVPPGEKGPSEKEIKDLKMVFTEDTVTPKVGDKDGNPGSYKLDPSKNPKEIDIITKEQTLTGIYMFDGDTLKLFMGEKGDRPKEFKPAKAAKTLIMTLKRDKK